MAMNAKAVMDAVTNEQYYVFPGTTMTVCCLTVHLSTGKANAVGYGDCVDPAEFNAETGREAARGRAMDKVFEMLGTHLKLGGSF